MNKPTLCSATWFLLSCSAVVFAAGDAAPVKMWTESGPGNGRSAYNIYYGGGVFNDHFYTGQLSYGPLAYARTQTGDGPSAMAYGLDIGSLELTAGDTYNGARSTVVIGDYIFFNRTDKDPVLHPHPRLNRLNSDWTHNVAFDMGNNGGDVAPEGMATDGTSLFTTLHTSKNVIRKYTISNQADAFNLTKTLEVTVAGASTFRGISCYDGFLYVADNGTTVGKGIYEINAATGAYTRIGSHAATKAYQAVRYHDRLFVIGQDGMLVVYRYSSGQLDAGTPFDLGLVELYGIGVVGTGTNVTGFWVTSPSGLISFFSFTLCNQPFADASGDNDIDQEDFGAFQTCFAGSAGAPAAELSGTYPCTCFDTDDSASVDLLDFAAFEKCMTGPAIPWSASADCP